MLRSHLCPFYWMHVLMSNNRNHVLVGGIYHANPLLTYL